MTVLMEVKLKQVLERECKASGKSVNAIADATGIPSSTLHAWLQGQLPSAKNLHHLHTLSEFFGFSLSMLLFNQREKIYDSTTLFSSEFRDQGVRYRLIVERIKD